MINRNQKREMKGMILPLGKAEVFIEGGPYRDRPANLSGVKMAIEIFAPCTVSIPTQDFKVPDLGDMWWGLAKSLWLLRTEGHIYVGCMGGIGRTGLFMAIMTRLLTGVDGPTAVTQVRKDYNPSAVETKDQKDYVAKFPLMLLKLWAMVLKINT